jgi:hypothetical protein
MFPGFTFYRPLMGQGSARVKAALLPMKRR